ncbi:MAG: ccmA [Alphaproteobacteria bacterium]|jgi:heme exporter protein A|nr:ccmA [Alphaproteobacteria bacterium]
MRLVYSPSNHKIIGQYVTASNVLFKLDDVSCTRGGRPLFQNLFLEMGEGDVVHLAGPNGTGKTSLLRVMAGTLPHEGRILWQDLDFLENGVASHAARYAFLPANDGHLKLLETAYENIAFWARLWGVGDDISQAALKAMGLHDLRDRPVRYFSAGQKRRLGLARVLMKGAKLWLFDEPLNGLDADSMALFRIALEHHAAKGGLAVIASHYPIDPPNTGTLRRITLGAA